MQLKETYLVKAEASVGWPPPLPKKNTKIGVSDNTVTQHRGDQQSHFRRDMKQEAIGVVRGSSLSAFSVNKIMAFFRK